MRTRVLLVMLVLAASAFAGDKKSGTPDFKKMLTVEYDAWNTLDTTKVAPFYAQDADLIFFDIAPLKYKGWSEWEKGVKVLLSAYQSVHLTVNDDVQGGAKGDLAWAACTLNFDAVQKTGAAEHLVLRETAVYQKRNGKWLIIHEHVSAPLAAPEVEKTTEKKGS